jgi:DNA (cytosine-5)-methyltransferase 1
MNYYNENNPYAVQWLKNLMAAKLIPAGDIDDRSIVDVTAGDVSGYRQCHFFAGIAGWSLALKIVKWPSDKPVWTASCPCPPWSRGRVWHQEWSGTRDDRDLWPVFFRLVKKIKPPVILGEQVAGKRARPWVDRLERNLEKENYVIESANKTSKETGGPQVRERFYFAANLNRKRKSGSIKGRNISSARQWRWRGEEDLRVIAMAPLKQNHRWPQPLVRRGDDGLPFHMANLRAYGNAIDPWVAAEFIGATFSVDAP